MAAEQARSEMLGRKSGAGEQRKRDDALGQRRRASRTSGRGGHAVPPSVPPVRGMKGGTSSRRATATARNDGARERRWRKQLRYSSNKSRSICFASQISPDILLRSAIKYGHADRSRRNAPARRRRSEEHTSEL